MICLVVSGLRGLSLILVQVHVRISEPPAYPVSCSWKPGTIAEPSRLCLSLFILKILLCSPITKLARGLLASTLEFCMRHRDKLQGSRACLKRGAEPWAGLRGLPLGWSRRHPLLARASTPGKRRRAAGLALAAGTLISPWAQQSSCWRSRRGELISKPFLFCARRCKYFTGLLKVPRVCFTLLRQGTLISWEDFCSAQSTEFNIERLSVRAVTLIFQLPKLRQSIKKCSSISNWCLTVYFM